MNIASIDIGTNTVLLLIANIAKPGEKINYLINKHRIPRIGKGLSPGMPFDKAKVEELFSILEEYRRVIKSHKCETILANATNAFRIASDSQLVIKEAYERFGIKIKVISGQEEARLSFLGATSEAAALKRIVIDIGGGSTEIIMGTKESISFSKSFSIGAVSLNEKFGITGAYDKEKLVEIRNYISDTFLELERLPSKGSEAFAVAGTPTSLSCIKYGLTEFDEDKVEGSFIYGSDLPGLFSYLITTPAEEQLKKYGEILKGREDILPAGTLILQGIMEKLSLEKIYVSTRGLRYGTVIDFVSALEK